MAELLAWTESTLENKALHPLLVISVPVLAAVDAMPLWIPQIPMAVGTVMLAVCFVDHLVRLVFTGSHGIRDSKVDEGAA